MNKFKVSVGKEKNLEYIYDVVFNGLTYSLRWYDEDGLNECVYTKEKGEEFIKNKAWVVLEGKQEPTGAIKSASALDKQISGNHYKDCKIQPIEYIQANGLSYLEGNVIKYTTRHSKKNGKADIEKAIHYLELILEMEYKDK